MPRHQYLRELQDLDLIHTCNFEFAYFMFTDQGEVWVDLSDVHRIFNLVQFCSVYDLAFYHGFDLRECPSSVHDCYCIFVSNLDDSDLFREYMLTIPRGTKVVCHRTFFRLREALIIASQISVYFSLDLRRAASRYLKLHPQTSR